MQGYLEERGFTLKEFLDANYDIHPGGVFAGGRIPYIDVDKVSECVLAS